jgi:hypothetical protein
MLVVVLACASVQHIPPELQLEAPPPAPGSGMGGQRVMVLPLSVIRNNDPLGWAKTITDPRAYLVSLNAQMAHALTTMAPRPIWVMPADIAKIAARSAAYAPDPYTLDVSQFDPGHWHPTTQLNDPLAGDLRMLTAFTDARIALIPVEVRFIPVPTPPPPPDAKPVPPAPVTEEIAVMRIAVVDTRFVTVGWTADVWSIPSKTLTPEVTESLANHFGETFSRP